MLRIREVGDNRALIKFDQNEIRNLIGSGTVISALLELNIAQNGNNWGRNGRAIAIHKMKQDWTESGATWNCPNDTNTNNYKPDCKGNEWEMDEYFRNANNPWIKLPSATTTITNKLSGKVLFDVSKDISDFLNKTSNYGWLIKKADEDKPGLIEFSSRETTNSPKLIIEFEPQ
jgi:hypothetical protein